MKDKNDDLLEISEELFESLIEGLEEVQKQKFEIFYTSIQNKITHQVNESLNKTLVIKSLDDKSSPTICCWGPQEIKYPEVESNTIENPKIN